MSKIKRLLNFYFEKTTLHGFSYITASQTWTEKVFWILAICSSLSCCLFLIYELIMKVAASPIVIQQTDKPVHIRNIPFPAISFCPASLIPHTFDIYTSLLMNNTVTYPYPDINWLKSQNSSNWRNIDNYLLNPMSFRGTWKKIYLDKSDYVISPFGWCKSFNILEFERMFHASSIAEYFQKVKGTDRGFVHEMFEYEKRNGQYALKKLAPVSPLFTQKKALGLYMANIRNHIGVTCPHHPRCSKNYSETFTIVIHSPFEHPDLRHRHFQAKIQQKYVLAIVPELKITHETILEDKVESRMCYKEKEKVLKFFKFYTRVNCLKECESNFILEMCGCVPYYFPISDRFMLCATVQQKTCFSSEYANFNETSCNCYPPCEETSYNIHIQMTQLSNFEESSFYALLENLIIANFKDETFLPQIRRKFFTTIDWFSSIGGILGLFFGFSFLSLFEFVYHLWLGILGSAKLVDERSKLNKHMKIILGHFKDFMDSSSIHGFNYISDGKMRMIERLAWVVFFGFSITVCTFMIIQLKHQTIDSVSVIATDMIVNITQLPFPAMMILFPVTPILGVNNIPKKLRTKRMRALHDYVSYMVDSKESMSKSKELMKKFNLTNYGHEIVPLLKNYTPNLTPILPWMAWNSKIPVPGQRILTAKGVNFNFNMKSFEEMFNEESISPDFLFTQKIFQEGLINVTSVPVPWYPKYGHDEKLFISMRKPKLQYFHMPALLFHSPFEYPFELAEEFSNRAQVRFMKILDIFITPELVTTSDDLKELPVEQRMCYLQGEKQLEFFKIYTQRNCQIECLSREMLKKCACIPFDLIRGPNSKVCELANDECYKHVRAEFSFDDKNCLCLQQCDFINYNYEFVQSNVRPFDKILKNPFSYMTHDDNDWNRGIANLRFKEKEFMATQRIRQFTVTDFLSQIGGLLGLFAGISVLSLFEIFYFFTIRVISELLKSIKKRKKRKIRHVKIWKAHEIPEIRIENYEIN